MVVISSSVVEGVNQQLVKIVEKEEKEKIENEVYTVKLVAKHSAVVTRKLMIKITLKKFEELEFLKRINRKLQL